MSPVATTIRPKTSLEAVANLLNQSPEDLSRSAVALFRLTENHTEERGGGDIVNWGVLRAVESTIYGETSA